MSPRKHDPEAADLGSRQRRRIRKTVERRAKGLPPPSALAREIALALWYHREMNGLSQHQLAEVLGMKQPQIARLESGFVTPNLETLARISERLAVDFTVEVKSGQVGVTWTFDERPATAS